MSADGSFEFAGAPSAEELSRLPLNDFGNAMRLARLVGCARRDDGTVDTTSATLLYLRERGWIGFNGRYWDLRGGEELARRWAHKVAGGLIAQAPYAIEAGVTPAAFWKFVQAAGNSGSSGSMLAQAQSYLGADLEDFDTDPMALNVANGVVRFRRDKSGKPVVKFDARHDPADRFTRMAAATYSAPAKAPLWDGLTAFCHRDLAMRRFVQKALSYCATANTDEQIFFIFQGKGNDGKSTLVNAAREVLGTYAVACGVETFLDSGPKRGGDASPDVARLAGDTRLISTSEPPSGSKLATGAIKSFTGGAPVTARELRQGIFEFTPRGKVILECNRRPTINDTDDGIWRRVRIVLFRRQVQADEVDRQLPAKLRLEASGILNWMIDGVLAWMAEGLDPPAGVLEAIEDYRRGANPFAGWANEKLILDPTAEETSKELYNSYKMFCEDEGHDRPMSATMFGRALGDMQILGRKTNGRKVRVGARLRTFADVAPAAVDDAPASPRDEGFLGLIDDAF